MRYFRIPLKINEKGQKKFPHTLEYQWKGSVKISAYPWIPKYKVCGIFAYDKISMKRVKKNFRLSFNIKKKVWGNFRISLNIKKKVCVNFRIPLNINEKGQNKFSHIREYQSKKGVRKFSHNLEYQWKCVRKFPHTLEYQWKGSE